MTKMDPHELAKKIHDRITKIQTDAGSKEQKYLTWDELKHPGFKGKYASYMDGFVAAIRELVTDPLSREQMPTLNEAKNFAKLLGARECYCCSGPFMPKTESQLACDRCIGEP